MRTEKRHDRMTKERTQSETKISEAERRLLGLLSGIAPVEERVLKAAGERWNSVAKPLKSLGILEEDVRKLAGIKGSPYGIHVEKTALAVMCADHGVVAEGVTQTGQEVTRIVAENFTKQKTSVTIMCQVTGTDVFPVDMGMIGGEAAGEADFAKEIKPFCLLNRKTACGSGNIVREPAMDRESCAKAVLAGIDLIGAFKAMGYDVAAAGEMGIGNTTPSSALAAVVTGLSAEEVTGRGAGLSDEGLMKKKAAVRRAVERFYETYPEYQEYEWTEHADPEAVLTLLAELGGFDIAGMAGLFIGAAVHRLPVVIDGVISSAAALLAVCMCGAVRDYILASHVSKEPAGIRIMETLGLKAPLDCGMHLGEGSGAVCLLPLLKMGARVYEEMSTFEEIHVENYVDYESNCSA